MINAFYKRYAAQSRHLIVGYNAVKFMTQKLS